MNDFDSTLCVTRIDNDSKSNTLNKVLFLFLSGAGFLRGGFYVCVIQILKSSFQPHLVVQAQAIFFALLN